MCAGDGNVLDMKFLQVCDCVSGFGFSVHAGKTFKSGVQVWMFWVRIVPIIVGSLTHLLWLLALVSIKKNLAVSMAHCQPAMLAGASTSWYYCNDVKPFTAYYSRSI
jgi:hypothetical protein